METVIHTTRASGLQLAVLRLLEKRLNDCRVACPGIGGDMDASNMRWLADHGDWAESSVEQACKTLASLGAGLKAASPGWRVDYGDALDAARELRELTERHNELVNAVRAASSALTAANLARHSVECLREIDLGSCRHTGVNDTLSNVILSALAKVARHESEAMAR